MDAGMDGIRTRTLFQAQQRRLGTHLTFEKEPVPRASMKPLALMKELVRRYSAPGHTLLDCCMGRGVDVTE